jgi:hypothetical protein
MSYTKADIVSALSPHLTNDCLQTHHIPFSSKDHSCTNRSKFVLVVAAAFAVLMAAVIELMYRNA